MIDLSNWYYTHSTISQTLAALYGFLLAAYTFRVTSSDAAQTARLAAYEEAARQNPPDYTTSPAPRSGKESTLTRSRGSPGPCGSPSSGRSGQSRAAWS